MNPTDERVLLHLSFTANERITDLPFYQGTLWSALFRELLRIGANIQKPLAEIHFSVHPVETGRVTWAKGERVYLGISFLPDHLHTILPMLTAFNDIQHYSGKLHPGTLTLETITCRVTGHWYDVKNRKKTGPFQPLDASCITRMAETLISHQPFHLIFHAPLRLKSPEPYRSKTGNRFVGADFFLSPAERPLDYLLEKIGVVPSAQQGEINNHTAPTKGDGYGNGGHDLSSSSSQSTLSSTVLQIETGSMVWQDCPYGGNTTLGGITGWLRVSGDLTLEAAKALIAGQYNGVGKNRTFGFGFYHIPECTAPNTVTPPHGEGGESTTVRPLTRGVSLYDKALSTNQLLNALDRLSNSSPGADGLTPADLKKAGTSFIVTFRRTLINGDHRTGKILTFRKEKKSGGYRLIHHFTAADRLLHRTIADTLQPGVESLLTDASFAYRRGLNRQGAARAILDAYKEGYRHGIKADISAFFESVDTDDLCDLIQALLPFDPLPDLIRSLLQSCRDQGISGLPQGSPLSPVLSNLYLDRFDRKMTEQGFRLIRFGDDFVLLFRHEGDEPGCQKSETACLDQARDALQSLGLTLNETKTEAVHHDLPFRFLGYEILSSRYTTPPGTEKEQDKEAWRPLFRESWYRGHPVYLTAICQRAYSSGPHLVIGYDTPAGKTEEIPWNRISRIVVVGRAGFSSGTIYRAVREEIPVTFIDIMGKECGDLIPTLHHAPSHESRQMELAADPGFCISFAREIISAKITNCYVLMRRNGIKSASLKEMALKAAQAETTAQLLGYEGNAARIYFQSFGALTTPFPFEKRIFHPPDNAVNAMLSFGYTLLYNRIAAALRNKGVSPYQGFFHQRHGRHCALASDLMEELRHLIDRIVLSLIHLKEVNTHGWGLQPPPRMKNMK